MTKVILVMDMPKRCNKCPCMKTLDNGAYCTKDTENYRYIDFAGRELGIDKPEWCPLIPKPEQKKLIVGVQTYEMGYNDGWNACIDYLEGKCNE